MKMKKEKEINPFDWNQISIKKYYDIKNILDSAADDITKNVRMIAVITERDESEIWDMDMSEVGDLVDKLRFLNKFDIPDKPNVKIQLPSYKLLVMKDLTKMTISQYVDFQAFVIQPLEQSFEKILSIFLIPEGKTYNNGYDIVEVQKELRDNLSFVVAEGLLAFFIKEYSKSVIRSLKYLKKIMKKEKNEMVKKELMEKQKRVLDQFQSLIRLTGCC